MLLISHFCQPRLYSPEAALSGTKYSPPVTLFKLSDAARNMLVQLYEWKDSAVFQQIWKKELRRVIDMNTFTVDDIEQSVWQQSKIYWENFIREMVGTYDCMVYASMRCNMTYISYLIYYR